jgi:hypothetical protein
VPRKSGSYPDQVRRQERAEIRNRYRRRRKGPPMLGPPASVRVAEIDRALTDRWGEILPHDDAGADDAFVMCHHLARRAGDPVIRMRGWLDRRAPWMPLADRQTLIERVLARPLRWKADTLAKRLGLTAATRTRLQIKTIGAIDQTLEERAETRRLRKLQDKQHQRQASGSLPRPQFEAQSIQQRQPWQALGISRRTWYRRAIQQRSTTCRGHLGRVK